MKMLSWLKSLFDPADAALGDGEASGSGITDATCDSDTPIGPKRVVTRDMDLSPGRRVAYRAGSVGWITTYIDE
eukprot:9456473-Pyramimonas_sp.AAC.1